jgi:nucleotide-binding universal stress UspA family protein
MQVLIAVDNSPLSAVIVDQILARSWAKATRFEVLHVAEPVHLWTLSVTAEELRRQSLATLDRVVSALQARGLDAEGVQKEGEPRHVILEHAADIRASLIVMGSRGASGVDRLLLGSVSSAVLRHADTSVWIIRPATAAPPRKVLLATDGSEYSESAARSMLARPFPPSTEVRVLSVVEFYLPPEVTLLQPPGVDSTRVEQIRTQAMAVAEDAVDAAVRIVSTAYPKVSQSISVLLDRPGPLILEEAKAWGADWIVVGSHGRRGLRRFLLGSVSEYVATHAHCSVAVVRS